MRRILPVTIIALTFFCLSACDAKPELSLTSIFDTSASTGREILSIETTESRSIAPKERVTVSDKSTQSRSTADIFVFSRENFPRLNGSTSTVPLGEAIASVLLGETREEVSDLISFDKTTRAYSALLRGEADLLIVGEPAESTFEEKDELHFDWEMEAFATDGFVFLVNAQNPVDSLTIEQIRKIYTGEIENWKDLGGENREIIPFQRNEEAGSQNIMKKLVMDGLEMLEPPLAYLIDTMEGLMKAVRSFDGSPGAIGYSVYYYAEEMDMAGGLKFLAINGVEPNPDTIRSGEYPLLNPKYVVMNAKTPEDSPTRLLYNWILSEEGQRLIAHEGYIPTH